MRDQIAYMNARRDLKPTSGGRNYAKPRNPVDVRDREASLDHHEVIMLQVDLMFAEFRSWARNLAPVGVAAEELEF